MIKPDYKTLLTPQFVEDFRSIYNSVQGQPVIGASYVIQPDDLSLVNSEEYPL